MTVTLNDVIMGEVPPGVYETRSRARAETMRRKAEERGWRFAHLDGHAISDKGSFLTAVARALDFPAYFGQNWDALYDSLTDLSWLPARGYLLLYDPVAPFADAAPDEWAAAHEVLSDAADSWWANDVPFYVLLRGVGDRDVTVS